VNATICKPLFWEQSAKTLQSQSFHLDKPGRKLTRFQNHFFASLEIKPSICGGLRHGRAGCDEEKL
jgi:hypothetical protein